MSQRWISLEKIFRNIFWIMEIKRMKLEWVRASCVIINYHQHSNNKAQWFEGFHNQITKKQVHSHKGYNIAFQIHFVIIKFQIILPLLLYCKYSKNLFIMSKMSMGGWTTKSDPTKTSNFSLYSELSFFSLFLMSQSLPSSDMFVCLFYALFNSISVM